MSDPFTSTKVNIMADGGRDRLWSIDLGSQSIWHFWARSAVMLWAVLKFNQLIFGFPPPMNYLKIEAIYAWHHFQIKEGLQWLLQH